MSRSRSSIWPLSTSDPPRMTTNETAAIAAGASRDRHSAGTRETMSAGHGESTANAVSAATKMRRPPTTTWTRAQAPTKRYRRAPAIADLSTPTDDAGRPGNPRLPAGGGGRGVVVGSAQPGRRRRRVVEVRHVLGAPELDFGLGDTDLAVLLEILGVGALALAVVDAAPDRREQDDRDEDRPAGTRRVDRPFSHSGIFAQTQPGVHAPVPAMIGTACAGTNPRGFC